MLETSSGHLKKWKEVLGRHTVSGVVVTCMDFRFCLKVRHAVRDKFGIQDGYNRYPDWISLAGGAYSIVGQRYCPAEFSETSKANQIAVFDSLEVAVKLHRVERIILCSHEKCGRCAQHGYKFERFYEEQAFHFGILQAAREEVEKRFPMVYVRGCFVYVDEAGLVQVAEQLEEIETAA